MERKVYLKRYRLHLDTIGLPTVIRRSTNEATFGGEDLRTGEEVAVQVVPLMALRTVAREGLEKEANAARKLNHINIPILHDFGFDDGQIVYVTEYFSGITAAQWIKSKGPMPIGPVLRVALQVVNAASAATFHGLVHHAINPSNIMLDPGQTNEGEWPLIKMLNIIGVAPNVAATPAGDPEFAGALNFVSPEELQTGEVDFRSQIYSLGATLWFLLSGAVPEGGAAAVESAGSLPAVVRELLSRMLAFDPNERPLDPLALQEQIQDCLAKLDRRDAVASKLGLPLASEATAPRITPRRPSVWKPIALAAVLLSIAAVTAVLLTGRGRTHETIGVPIGVPEKSTAPLIVAAQNPSPAEENSVATVSAAKEPAVLTSTANAPTNDETSSSDSGTTENAEPSVEVVANNPPETEKTASAEEPAVRVVEAAPSTQTDAAASPAEIVAINPSPPPEPKGITQSAAEGPTVSVSETPTPPLTVTESQRAPAKSKPSEETPIAARPNERSNKKARVVTAPPAAEQTSAPHGEGRPQFLGTTPEGDLVFGLSSSEKVHVAPPTQNERTEHPRPKPRRTPPETIDGLPVRPALPPDQ